MKFRTELKIAPLGQPIDYADPVLLLGSCFAERMREKLSSLKFRASGNFCGPLFNPASVAATLRRAAEGRAVGADELHRGTDGLWFHYAAHTLVSDPDPQTVLDNCNAGQETLRKALTQARHVVITFGTAWVYRLCETGAVVANCHKQPAGLFSRERLTVAEIVADWSALLEGPLAGRQVILTVSPVRHLGDGLEGNCLSKSILAWPARSWRSDSAMCTTFRPTNCSWTTCATTGSTPTIWCTPPRRPWSMSGSASPKRPSRNVRKGCCPRWNA